MPEACQLLETRSRGARESVLTAEAKAALERLAGGRGDGQSAK